MPPVATTGLLHEAPDLVLVLDEALDRTGSRAAVSVMMHVEPLCPSSPSIALAFTGAVLALGGARNARTILIAVILGNSPHPQPAST